MSLRALWWFLAISLPVLASLIAKISTVDLAYQLRAGAEILATGRIPTTDTWTFTMAGQPWVDQQWAAQVILRAVESVGGWVGLAVSRAVLVGAIFGGTCLIAVRRGLDVRTAAILSLLAFVVAAPALALRPQLLGMLCFVGVLLLVVDRRAHPGRLWLAPVVVAIWANIHGSFFLGPLVLGLAWLEDVHDRQPAAMRTLAITGVAALAACLTPSGPLVWLYAGGLTSNASVTARVTEWQPTSIRDVPGLSFFASALAIVTLMARSERRVAWPTLAWLGVFFLIGVYAQRGVAWWPIAAVTAIAGTLLPAFPGRAKVETQTMRRLNALVAGVLVLALFLALPANRPAIPGAIVSEDWVSPAPARITASLRDLSDPGARVLDPQTWGSWFEYALPQLEVAVDSRIEMFKPEVWSTYESIVAGQDGWERRMAEWGVTHVVVDADQSAFRDRLVQAGWQVAYEDDNGALLIPGG
ncbi:MAG: hypothetical protein ACJ78H_10815 [Chloroflexota bacterium]